jgi:hypothetical protein
MIALAFAKATAWLKIILSLQIGKRPANRAYRRASSCEKDAPINSQFEGLS